MQSDRSEYDSGAQAEDEAALARFTELFSASQRRIFSYALALLHDLTEAEEVLQETGLILWQKFGQFRPGTDFASWACRVARHRAYKRLEKRGRRERLLSGEFLDMLVAAAESADGSVDSRLPALEQCLKKLPEEDRRLVMLRYQQGANTRGVAEAFGRSVQGTRKSLHRIRTRLLECIQRTLAKVEHP